MQCTASYCIGLAKRLCLVGNWTRGCWTAWVADRR